MEGIETYCGRGDTGVERERGRGGAGLQLRVVLEQPERLAYLRVVYAGCVTAGSPEFDRGYYQDTV